MLVGLTDRICIIHAFFGCRQLGRHNKWSEGFMTYCSTRSYDCGHYYYYSGTIDVNKTSNVVAGFIPMFQNIQNSRKLKHLIEIPEL